MFCVPDPAASSRSMRFPDFPQSLTGIITGGNGEFQRARGQADIEPRTDGTTVITFHLFG